MSVKSDKGCWLIFQIKDSELQQLGLRHKTANAHPAIGYLPIFESLLDPLRAADMQFMELGAGPIKTIGASFYMWRDYFHKAEIIGIDNKKEAASIKDETGRIKIEIGDLGSDLFLEHLRSSYTPTVIIDDASHIWAHQISSFETLFSCLKPGGIYIVEDVHTSYGTLRADYGANNSQDAFSYFTTISNLICGRNEPHPLLEEVKPTEKQVALASEIKLIVFARRLIIMYKYAVKPKIPILKAVRALNERSDTKE